MELSNHKTLMPFFFYNQRRFKDIFRGEGGGRNNSSRGIIVPDECELFLTPLKNSRQDVGRGPGVNLRETRPNFFIFVFLSGAETYFFGISSEAYAPKAPQLVTPLSLQLQ